MNAIARGVVFMLGLSLFTACSESEILDLEPFQQISEDAAFSTAELVNLSVNGMYQAAQRGDFNGALRGYPFGAAFVQQGDNRGEDVVNVFTFYQLTYTATYDPTTANNVFYWSDTYRLINRANIVIDGVTKAQAAGIITSEVADDFIGQAKFFRGISHLELLQHFARPFNDTPGATHEGIPYREIPFTTPANIELGLAQGRNTVGEAYAKVIADLNDAEQLMMSATERGRTGQVWPGIIRATSEAAIAMKTRAYLNMRQWQNVITEGNKIINSYALTPDPNTVFANGYSNTESIFSILQTETNNPGVNAGLASMYKTRRLVVMSPIIWRNEFWLTDDKRRSSDLITDNEGRKYTHKYKDGTNYTDPAPIIRFAEVLLNMAEAEARLDGLDRSLELLNRVRDRSLANPAAQSYSAFANKGDLIRAIIAERRIEFVMEGRRWPDIHRLQKDEFINLDGTPAKVANGLPPASAYVLGAPYTGPFGVDAVPYSDFRFIWPIPQQELNNNPGLSQNPGY